MILKNNMVCFILNDYIFNLNLLDKLEKSYETQDEELFRFAVFFQNLEKINSLNEQPNKYYEYIYLYKLKYFQIKNFK
jgi:hypothetical protein